MRLGGVSGASGEGVLLPDPPSDTPGQDAEGPVRDVRVQARSEGSTVSDEKALVRQAARALKRQEEDNRCLEIMRRVSVQAAKVVEGLFVEPGSKGYNADASVPWAEASTKTRAALAIVKDERIIAGAKAAGSRPLFGVIVLPGRQSNDEWERQAAKTIDVEVSKP